MGNQQILVLFLKALVAAKKSLALYPSGSQMAQEWIQRLHRSLRSFFQAGVSFPIRVGRDRFMWEGEELLMLDPALEAFRFDLESRGIAEFSIDPQVEDWELERFLDLLNQPAANLESLAGAAEYLRAKTVVHVTVRGPALSQKGAVADVGAGGEGYEPDELDLMVEAVLQKLAERFTDLAYDRTALRDWFAAIVIGDRGDVLVAAVRMMGAMAEGTSDRELRIRTMIEALLGLPDSARRPFLTTWLIPAAGDDLLAFNLLTQLTEDEMSEVVRLVPDGDLMALNAALQEFPWEEGKRQRLLEAIALALQRKGVAEAPVDIVASLSRDDPLLLELREEITGACQSDRLLERSVQILLAIFRVENEEYPGFALDALEEMSGEAIARGRLDLALDILKTLAGASHLGREWMREHPSRFALFLRRAGSRTHVSLLVGVVRGPKGAEQMPLVAEYLRIVGREAVEEFTTLLADEKSRRVRARLCQVLATVGSSTLPVLLRWLDDGRWYVVRNIVGVLGKIGDQSAFLPVVSQLDHGHARVRLEAVRGLGLIGGRAAVGPLIRCLRDPDAEVRNAAIKVLGSLQDDDAVPALCEIVNRRRRDAPDELAFKREAIAALVATGTELARRSLTEMATRRLWLWKRAERRVRALAAAALASSGPVSAAPWSDDA